MKKDTKNIEKLTNRLNDLLAAYQVAYFNTRASHWLIKGENFFELHKVFETAYNDATVKIDDIAERILTLGGVPMLFASRMIKSSEIAEKKITGDQMVCVKGMIEDLSALEIIENDIVKMAGNLDDYVTADMITKYLGEQQKTNWMLYQFLSKKSHIEINK
ncbi:MAG: DNA starvation/stationary phase protection protein [Bacteroidota bacterium]